MCSNGEDGYLESGEVDTNGRYEAPAPNLPGSPTPKVPSWMTRVEAHCQPVAKKIAKASGATDFNILQNNGRIAHQVVDHIPKPNEKEGMSIGWPSSETNMDKLKALHEEIKSKM
ncbi:hypothetical protein VI817_005204 [Penicillium citrinum]|nr:hypothetical protein VI817_005204 [Penicillium citrinum]